jgi:hypothetical protein
LQSRAKLLDDALAAEDQAENALSLTEKRFLQTDVALGIDIAHRQTHAAIKLAEAISAPDAARMWQSVYEARSYLELLETEFARGEYPPFDRWYHESWIRSTYSNNNPHRAYNQLRDFIGKDGIGSLPLPPPRGGVAPARGAGGQ